MDPRSFAKFLNWPLRGTPTMYTGKQARLRPLQPAFIMASTGETVTYRYWGNKASRIV